MTTTVVCRQLAPRLGDVVGNLELADAAIATSVATGADIVVLPELASSGYCFDSPQEARVAARRPDEIAQRWRAVAGDAVIAGGFAEVADDGRLFNSALLLVPGADPVVYRKLHLWDREGEFFSPGGAPPPVVDTPYGRLAMMVCYDLEFPEMTRRVALQGAQLLLVPTNWPWVDRPAGHEAPEVVIAMGAARVNRMAVACCDRAGTERGQDWNSASVVIAADGWPVARADEDGVARAELDLDAASDKWISSRNHVHDDRRTEVY